MWYATTTTRFGKRSGTANSKLAWFSVSKPEQGWVDFDPTNNQLPGETCMHLAYGRNYHDIAPMQGLVDVDSENRLKDSVHVEAIDSEPSNRP